MIFALYVALVLLAWLPGVAFGIALCVASGRRERAHERLLGNNVGTPVADVGASIGKDSAGAG